MDPNNSDAIHAQFAIPGHVRFGGGPGGLVTAFIENDHCSAALTTAGAHVISFRPAGQADMFWMSPNSTFCLGKPIRGGIPICWPWFGPHPVEPQEKPMHGFARLIAWDVQSTRALDNGATEIRLAAQDTAQTKAWWPFAFALELRLTFGEDFSIDLTVRNTDNQPFTYTGALHSYFLVSDVYRVSVAGLEDCDYLDKVDQFQRKQQVGAVNMKSQTDRVYLDTEATCVISDPGMGRSIHIAKRGSRTTVVWNPAERAAQMPDIGAGNEREFICVETANAAGDIVEVNPGGESHLAAHMWFEQLGLTGL